jgi:hypothetical protein
VKATWCILLLVALLLVPLVMGAAPQPPVKSAGGQEWADLLVAVNANGNTVDHVGLAWWWYPIGEAIQLPWGTGVWSGGIPELLYELWARGNWANSALDVFITYHSPGSTVSRTWHTRMIVDGGGHGFVRVTLSNPLPPDRPTPIPRG